MATLTNITKAVASVLTNTSKIASTLVNSAKSVIASIFLLEDDGYFLLENGDSLLLETTSLTNVTKN